MSEGKTRTLQPGRTDDQARGTESRLGVLYALGAHGVWGVIPLYFRLVAHVPPWVVLCHRILWSALLIAVIITWRREWNMVVAIIRAPRNFGFLTLSAVLIASNWLLFIYSVGSRQVLQASLGYFMNPLLTITLGMIFLHESLRRMQWFAVLIAALAVTNLAMRSAGFPWLALSLAGSFGFYGLVRKKVNVNSLHGLLVETLVLAPLAGGALLFIPSPSQPASMVEILALSGITTVVPLLFFGAAVRRLTLSTMGFLQFIGPSLQFLLAIFAFKEPLDHTRLISFMLCWAAIAVYLADSVVARGRRLWVTVPE